MKMHIKQWLSIIFIAVILSGCGGMRMLATLGFTSNYNDRLIWSSDDQRPGWTLEDPSTSDYGREFPDGLIGQQYSFVPISKNGVAPLKVSLKSGELPPGLVLDKYTGRIQGVPSEAGVWKIKLRIKDAQGRIGTFSGNMMIMRSVLTVGGHGTYKGFKGLQDAVNAAVDLDEIRLEKGIYEGAGLIISQKKWQKGVIISGGWNETFSEKSADPGNTILDGSSIDRRILTVNDSETKVFIDNVTFKNSRGGAVSIEFESVAIFSNCNFTNNSANVGSAVDISGEGVFRNCAFTNNIGVGTVFINLYSRGSFIDCIFANNSGSSAVRVFGKSAFTNCKFTNNRSLQDGGAVYVGNVNNTIFTNSIFVKNSAENVGGAIEGGGIFNNCTFYGNKAKHKGGAINGDGSVHNSIFFNNTIDGSKNDITPLGKIEIDNSLINYLTGSKNYEMNNIAGDPKFIDADKGDFHVHPDSPCINTGNNKYIENYKFELDGILRLVGENVDMGAYEWQGVQ